MFKGVRQKYGGKTNVVKGNGNGVAGSGNFVVGNSNTFAGHGNWIFSSKLESSNPLFGVLVLNSYMIELA